MNGTFLYGEIEFQSQLKMKQIGVKFNEKVQNDILNVFSIYSEAVGKPIPKSKWLKNGREVLEQPGRITKEEKNGRFTLTIEELWEIDEGEYTCQAFNSFGYALTTCKVKVGAPPKIESIPTG